MSNNHPLRVVRVVLVVLQIVCWLAMIWPGALLANRIRPFVPGLPFMYFWYIAWILVMTADLFLLYHLEYRGSGVVPWPTGSSSPGSLRSTWRSRCG